MGRLREIYPAEPYRYNALGSFGLAANMLIHLFVLEQAPSGMNIHPSTW